MTQETTSKCRFSLHLAGMRRFILTRRYLLFPIQRAARIRLSRVSHVCSVQSLHRGFFLVRTDELTMLQRAVYADRPRRWQKCTRRLCQNSHLPDDVQAMGSLRVLPCSDLRMQGSQLCIHWGHYCPWPTSRSEKSGIRLASTAPLRLPGACSKVAKRDSLADASATTAAQSVHPPVFKVCRELLSERPLVRCRPNHRLPPHSSSK